jgi:hypothetical protein
MKYHKSEYKSPFLKLIFMLFEEPSGKNISHFFKEEKKN